MLPHWRVFLASLLSMAVLAATEPAIPALLKPTIDGSFVEKDLSAVSAMAMLLVLVFLVRGASGFAGAVTLTWVSSRLVIDLRARMFDKLVTLPTRYYDQTTTGALISKVTFDATQVTDAATHVITVLMGDVLLLSSTRSVTVLLFLKVLIFFSLNFLLLTNSANFCSVCIPFPRSAIAFETSFKTTSMSC